MPFHSEDHQLHSAPPSANRLPKAAPLPTLPPSGHLVSSFPARRRRPLYGFGEPGSVTPHTTHSVLRSHPPSLLTSTLSGITIILCAADMDVHTDTLSQASGLHHTPSCSSSLPKAAFLPSPLVRANTALGTQRHRFKLGYLCRRGPACAPERLPPSPAELSFYLRPRTPSFSALTTHRPTIPSYRLAALPYLIPPPCPAYFPSSSPP